ncbi:hypothetical protein ACIPL1_27340 [Pseudomonas sp. NPDC090202]|uniref:hypothetical protein n=1 Tax=Pseudomonas sp. NPDC090202 TaxID=3364476 RepID=UPI003819CD04
MKLRRYAHSHGIKVQRVDATEFVAFWSGDKQVHAMDANGKEWRLFSDVTLQMIEKGVTGLIRAHRGTLLRLEVVDRVMVRHVPGNKHAEHFCTVGGREFGISRKYKSAFYYAYHTHVAQHGFASMAVAA